MAKKFRFIERSTEVISIEKEDEYITTTTDANVFYSFNPDKDGLIAVGVGGAGFESGTSKQWFRPSDLREFADLLNFLADEGDKVQ